MELDLLLAHADDRSSVLGSGLPEDAAYSGPKPRLIQPKILLNKGGDLDDLGLQRWAIVLPKTPAGELALAAIKPLQELRQSEQGDAPIKIFRVDPGMSAEDAIDWRNNVLQNDPDG